ncbi:Hypothetical_protein [Hexamita inflata]|uniref:Hypothetical_protein n=1 Tax=Hexamita inflata TaxID=28002 RepID=A0AA86Q4G8_9EUKA|nr:Hypothetical protein HINF_LOCUS33547 [Hexamita inflata]
MTALLLTARRSNDQMSIEFVQQIFIPANSIRILWYYYQDDNLLVVYHEYVNQYTETDLENVQIMFVCLQNVVRLNLTVQGVYPFQYPFQFVKMSKSKNHNCNRAHVLENEGAQLPINRFKTGELVHSQQQYEPSSPKRMSHKFKIYFCELYPRRNRLENATYDDESQFEVIID